MNQVASPTIHFFKDNEIFIILRFYYNYLLLWLMVDNAE